MFTIPTIISFLSFDMKTMGVELTIAQTSIKLSPNIANFPGITVVSEYSCYGIIYDMVDLDIEFVSDRWVDKERMEFMKTQYRAAMDDAWSKYMDFAQNEGTIILKTDYIEVKYA